MLQVFAKDNGWLPIANTIDYYTEYEYGGTEILCFSISTNDSVLPYLIEETNIKNEYNLYKISKRNQLSTTTSFECVLDLDDWKTNEPYINTAENSYFQTKSLSEILEYIKPSGWLIQNANYTNELFTLELEFVNNYEILWMLPDVYGHVYKVDTINKVLKVIDVSAVQDDYLYITPELNLSDQVVKSTGEALITRLYCQGKDGLTFASINNGKSYVECFDYTTRIITGYWKEDEYTKKEDLLKAAKAKIKTLAMPSISTTIEFNDLARSNPKYSFLDFGLYSIAHVLLEEDRELIERVVRYRVYHDKPEQNLLTLSTEPQKLTKKVAQVKEIVNSDGTKYQGSILQQSQLLATALISSAIGGYIVKTRNELYIMDTDNVDTAKKVWRWNVNGLAYSSNGINGLYELALTADGKIVADRITTGILKAIEIQGANIKGSKITGTVIKGCEITGTNIETTSDYRIINLRDGTLQIRKKYEEGTTLLGSLGQSRAVDDAHQWYYDGIYLSVGDSGNTAGIECLYNKDGEWDPFNCLKFTYHKDTDNLKAYCDLLICRSLKLQDWPLYFNNEAYTGWYNGGAAIFLEESVFSFAMVRNNMRYALLQIHDTLDIYIDTEINGDVDIYGKIIHSSDERLKDNIQETKVDALDIIEKLALHEFDWLESGKHEDIGLIAQQVQEVCPHLVKEGKNGSLAIDTTGIIYYLIGAIQQLKNDQLSKSNWKTKFKVKEKKEFLKGFLRKKGES